MKVVLELQTEASNIRRVTIRHDIVIGRGTDCNLRISAPQVSRRHCFLQISSAGVAVTDLESCNGTWLNGQKTIAGKRYFIEDGMKLAVGPVCFVARVSDEEVESEPSGETVTHMSPRHNPALSPSSMLAGSLDFAIEHAGDAAEGEEPTVDSASHDDMSALVDSSEIEIIGAESKEVILLDNATVVIDGSVSVEAIDLVVAVEVIDEELDEVEILEFDEVADEDGADALQDFLQDKE